MECMRVLPLVLLAFAGGAVAAPTSLAGCPATRAELDAAVQPLAVQSRTPMGSGERISYLPAGLTVFGLAPKKLQATFDPKRMDVLLVELVGDSRQFPEAFKRSLGADAQCRDERNCFWARKDRGMPVGALAMAKLRTQGMTATLECSYRSVK